MKLRIWLGRIIPLVVIVIGEVRLYYVLFRWLTSSFVYIELILHGLSILIILNIIRTSRHLSSDLMWIIYAVSSIWHLCIFDYGCQLTLWKNI